MSEQTTLDSVIERALSGNAIGEADRAALLHTTDLLTLGMAADEVRRRRHGARVTFVRVAALTLDAALSGPVAVTGVPGEITIVGPLDDLERALAAVAAVKKTAGSIAVTGFSLADIDTVTHGARSAAATLAGRLKEAGLAAVADAPVDRLPNAVAMLDGAADAGLPVARLSVERGIGSDRGALLNRVREMVAGRTDIRVFAPLPRRVAGTMPSTGYEDVRLVALARLWLPVDHIQVDWSLYGPKLAQVALTFGADDLDAVSAVDDMTGGRRRAPLEEVLRNIRAASGEPMERDPFFQPVSR